MKIIDHSSVVLSLVDLSARKNSHGVLHCNDGMYEQRFNNRNTLMAWLEQIFSELVWKGV